MSHIPPPLQTFEWLKLIREVRMPAPVNNVAAWVCTFGDQDGTRIYPGIEKLMVATGLSRDTVVQALSALRESGLLVRTRRGGGRGSRLSDEYQLGVPEGMDSTAVLGKMVTAAYESARPIRKRRSYESDKPTRKIERGQNESDLQAYESDLHAYESACPTPPTRDQPVDQPEGKNTAAPRRERTADADAPADFDPFDPWREDIEQELINDLNADAAEVSIITGMLAAGAHPKAIRNKISADRFGPRSQRTRVAQVICRHGQPVAVDGSVACDQCLSAVAS